MKIIKKILIGIFVVVLLAISGIVYLYKDIYMAATSTTKLEENVYALEFKGDYGMNEKGFMIADLLAGDKEATHQESDKVSLTTVSALRYVLDYTATVDEAIGLLETIDYNSSIGYAHHFFMADASGNYAVVEYVDNQMVVTKSKLLTNHYLAKQKEGIGSQNSHLRFSIIQDALDKANHSMNINEVKQTINSVRVKDIVERTNITDNDVTLWQIVYNPKDLSATFYYNQDDEHSYSIRLKETKWVK